MACLIPCMLSARDHAGTFYTCGLDGDHVGDRHYDPARRAFFAVDPVTGLAQVTR